jgi:hypothetical protein
MILQGGSAIEVIMAPDSFSFSMRLLQIAWLCEMEDGLTALENSAAYDYFFGQE